MKNLNTIKPAAWFLLILATGGGITFGPGTVWPAANQAKNILTGKSDKSGASDDPEIQKLKKEIQKLRLRKEKLALEERLLEMRWEKQNQARSRERKTLELENALRAARKKKELAGKLEEKFSRNLEIDLEKAEFRKAELEMLRQKNAIVLETQKLNLKKTRLAVRLMEREKEIAETRLALQKQKLRHERAGYAEGKIRYRRLPFQNGILTVTDRRVELNGVIVPRKAAEIARQIEYYNNKSDLYPIFLVIDSSPGGSVMAGYQIIQAMKASRAPVHVLVKSYAASMAAIITAHADHSYTFASSVLLHHQMSSWNIGNLTQQKEALRTAEDWSRRLLGPVAKKMDLTMRQFVREMYRNNSDGDWREFGDKARELGWVTNLVREVREVGIRRQREEADRRSIFPFFPRGKDTSNKGQPTRYRAAASVYRSDGFPEERGPDGKPFVRLPRLNPVDFYLIYNPDGYYR